MEKIVVIASNSFTGSHVVDQLLEEGKKVIGISRSPEYNMILLPYLYKKDLSQNFSFYKLDINTDLNNIMKILDYEKPEGIVNLAAQGEVQHSWDHPEDWFNTNSLGIGKLIYELSRRDYIKRYIHTSTPEVYGTCIGGIRENFNYNPSTPYAASKAAGDLFMRVYSNQGFPLTLIRSTNVYGIHQQLYRIMPRTIIYLKQGRKIQLHGGGLAKKAFIHVRDVADGIIKALESEDPSELYHLSPNSKGYSIKEIVELICNKMDYKFEDSTESVGERLGQDAAYEINSELARKELCWKPKIDLEVGISEMVDWINSNWEEIESLPHDYIHKA